ncbi:hypothetical protein B0H17DRAFT_949622 [Mycena rosella]|uniref:C2H2-type domain-containing protein n=1 Tax=Mycena rosella TaxID=1033263 RepID=A0AAD7CXZ8_MYCRO|nr:hypothetical protein B0H17DRAFT_949622 [Mycena rosella]
MTPSRTDSSSESSNGSEEDEIDYGEEGEVGVGRKHVCQTCGKHFNRPSSLRIHVNVHTGATPYRCPYPGCGRAFNVNSNMRRHLRNHSSPVNFVPLIAHFVDGGPRSPSGWNVDTWSTLPPPPV